MAAGAAGRVSIKGLKLHGIKYSAQRFESTPFLERVHATWLDDDDLEAVTRYNDYPQAFCPLTIIGYWGPSSDRVVIRYMPCIDLGTLPGQMCGEHAKALRPKPTPARAPQPVPPVQEKARCRDCGDILPSHERKRCSRCFRVWQQAERLRKEEQYRFDYPPAVYHCLACRKRIDLPSHGPQLCPLCTEQRYVEQPEESVSLERAFVGDGLPASSVHFNARGEWVIGGRVSRHKPFGDSTWDIFGDTPEEE